MSPRWRRLGDRPVAWRLRSCDLSVQVAFLDAGQWSHLNGRVAAARTGRGRDARPAQAALTWAAGRAARWEGRDTMRSTGVECPPASSRAAATTSARTTRTAKAAQNQA